jgi:glycosyltransferase involved in cell wall biosynthesis
MKVAFFIPYFGDGGVERTTLILSQMFIKDGHSVDIITLKPWGPFLKQMPSEIRVVNLHTRRTLTAIPKLITYLRKEQPTALISAQHYANIVSIWACMLSRAKTKLIITERLALSEAFANKRNFREYVLPLLIRWFYQKAEAVVANSEGGAEDLACILGWMRQRIHVIYNPTYDDSILEKSQEPLNHPWFQPGEPPVILGVGRLTHQKDFATLIRAFAIVRKELECRLVILGEGEERPKLEALAKELGIGEDVDLPGFVDNPYKYMARASLFVLSSRYEGLPNVLIEALACGTPVVSTDCPSGPREILMNGKGGLLVPVGNAEKMATAILKLLRDKSFAQSLLQFAREHLDRFKPETCYKAYLRLIEDEQNKKP